MALLKLVNLKLSKVSSCLSYKTTTSMIYNVGVTLVRKKSS